ncbi:hypothetical protein Cni_G12621 [Canna indica]|uniref:Uncharacterized protein n=1 Tax=Canna indica TaxID=4628 RepID=A0AAQ3QBY2_9LILI|nr:hypothetical protein Cni_G12621 [Canna indica]
MREQGAPGKAKDQPDYRPRSGGGGGSGTGIASRADLVTVCADTRIGSIWAGDEGDGGQMAMAGSYSGSRSGGWVRKAT